MKTRRLKRAVREEWGRGSDDRVDRFLERIELPWMIAWATIGCLLIVGVIVVFCLVILRLVGLV